MRPRHHALLLVATLALAGCDSSDPMDAGGGADAGALDAGAGDAGGMDAGPTSSDGGGPGGDAGAPDAGTGGADAGSPDSGAGDAGAADAGAPDAGGPLTFDVRIRADGFCDMLSFDPASIAVPAGTEFTVNWINATGCTDIDIDMGGTVPIVIGLPPGGSYHDTIRRWCGTYTGTYTFRAYYAPSYPFTMLADCDA